MNKKNLRIDFDDSSAVVEFLKTGYVSIEIDPKIKIISKRYFDLFQNFCKEPAEYKRLWTIDLSMNKKPDTGYLRRDDEEHKHFMHFHSMLRKILYLRNVSLGAYAEMLMLGELLSWYSHQRILCFVNTLDLEQGFSLTKYFEGERSFAQSVGRGLQYDAVSFHKELAELHSDQSGFTLCVDETHSGLFLNELSNLYEHKENTALLFPGKKLQLITGGEQSYSETEHYKVPVVTGGEIKALPHGVVSLPEIYGVSYSRSSFVYFAHPENTSLWPKQKKPVSTSFVKRFEQSFEG